MDKAPNQLVVLHGSVYLSQQKVTTRVLLLQGNRASSDHVRLASDFHFFPRSTSLSLQLQLS